MFKVRQIQFGKDLVFVAAELRLKLRKSKSARTHTRQVSELKSTTAGDCLASNSMMENTLAHAHSFPST